MMRAWLIGGIVGMVVVGAVASADERRPISQLPADLARWSTVWVAIPQQMVAVGRESGAIAGLTVGPAKGAARMVESTGKELWTSMRHDESRARRDEGRGTGSLLIHYEF